MTTNEDKNPRIFVESMVDYLVELLVSNWIKEPCLVDPDDEDYRDKKKRQNALQKLVTIVNEDHDERNGEPFTLEEVEANMKFIRERFRDHRLARCEYYMKKKKLPHADKWYEWMYYGVRDENKFIYKHYIPHIKNKAEAAKKRSAASKKIFNSVKRYLDAEEKFFNGEMSPCDSEMSSDEGVPAKKAKKSTDELLHLTFNL